MSSENRASRKTKRLIFCPPQPSPLIQRRRDAQQKAPPPPPPHLVLVRQRTLALQHRMKGQMQRPTGNQTLRLHRLYFKKPLQRLLTHLET